MGFPKAALVLGIWRHKIEDNKDTPVFIKSVRGVGYLFDYEFKD